MIHKINNQINNNHNKIIKENKNGKIKIIMQILMKIIIIINNNIRIDKKIRNNT